MHTVKLRRVGGSVMLAVPPGLLNALDLTEGDGVGLTIEDGRLVVSRHDRPRYHLDELLDEADAAPPLEDDLADWHGDAPVGHELL